jgi:uncharacterized protein YjbI with pentapeptide repeats
MNFKRITVEELLRRFAAGERDFTEINIRDSREGLMRGIDLSGINLEGSSLSVDFSGAILRETNFRYTVWDIVTWEDIDFSGSDFTGINNVVGCAFIRCNFNDTIWSKANLWQACFVDSTLTTANFDDAKFSEVNFFTESQFFGY